MEGKLFAVGGNDVSRDVDVFDQNLGEWKVVENSIKISREHHAAALVDIKYFPECQ